MRTAQGVLEETIRHVFREPVRLVGASRTDSGVHARGQVAAFTAEKELDLARLTAALNTHLPDDLQVVKASIVHDDFNPISNAIAKGYRYRLAHGRKLENLPPLFDRRITARTPHLLDVAPMQEAAQCIIGEHDFASFTRRNHGRESTIRTVHDCTVTATTSRLLRIDVSGNGFLYNMVRIIAGTLMEVGRGHISPTDLPRIFEAKDRGATGPTLPAEGLCLMWIQYP